MILRKKYNNKCWWCGNIADSREHKFKKTDIIREFGFGPYHNMNEIIKVVQNENTNEQISILGPKSKHLKFKSNICKSCNGKRSKNFDNAYDIFTKYIKNNENKIYSNKILNFSDIFGQEWLENIDCLTKYLIKHICCRLSETNIEIDNSFIDYLNNKNNLKYIKIDLFLRTDLFTFLELLKNENKDTGYTGITQIIGCYNKKLNYFDYLESSMQYRSIEFSYIYNKKFETAEISYNTNKYLIPEKYNIHPDLVKKMFFSM